MTDSERIETIKKLRRAIATLKTQRDSLGDTVIEAALGPMREQLLELERIEGKDDTPLDGERKVVTVLFADLSGLSSHSEKIEPEQMRRLVNECYSCCVPIIDKFGGTVEKFIGDEILAIFGAPVTHENDPERALQTALDLLDAADTFNTTHGIDIGMRIGVSTGLVIAGGIGTKGKQQYGVTGDCVK